MQAGPSWHPASLAAFLCFCLLQIEIVLSLYIFEIMISYLRPMTMTSMFSDHDYNTLFAVFHKQSKLSLGDLNQY